MLKIKLQRTGKRGFSSYKIVVSEARSKRDGRYLELLGHYNPNTKPITIKVDKKRLKHWLDHGAQFTPTTRRLISQYK